ncbi:MAG: undecaprenyl-diphosphate phosphatase [Rhodospirillaceae bacterium]|nr:undecaprenyl-diphosphate phosphatase [Rhodospirillaceae bacterium]
MTLLQLFVLALVQGITEFLPISSSAHLVLIPELTGWQDQGLAIDVAVHLGTLGAVVLYFRHDLARMAVGAWRLVTGQGDRNAHLALKVVVASLPVIGAGFAVNALMGEGRNLFLLANIIAVASIVFGLLLWWVDRRAAADRRAETLGYAEAVLIGCAQALALIPGTSRSGITMTAARWLRLTRTEAARFSLLLAIPAILGAGVLKGAEVVAAGDVALGRDALVAAALSFVSALGAIFLMMKWLERASFAPFVVYRVVLGLALLAYLHFGLDTAAGG